MEKGGGKGGKATRRKIYRELTKAFGNPLAMGDAKKIQVLISLGGWLYQSKSAQRRYAYRWSIASLPGRKGKGDVEPPSMVEKHYDLAKDAFPIVNWHWKINALPKPPKATALGKVVLAGVPANPPWDWRSKDAGKRINILIPLNYHKTVPKDLRLDGRKIVQRLWNHRVYSDKEVWQCSYWDFSALSRDESTWSKAKWHEGYLVKMDIAIAIEPTLQRAIAVAVSRTIRKGMNSVLADLSEEERRCR